jgi:hypothetical protein
MISYLLNDGEFPWINLALYSKPEGDISMEEMVALRAQNITMFEKDLSLQLPKDIFDLLIDLRYKEGFHKALY